MSEAVIDIQGLTKVYRTGMRRTPVHAVKNLALTVPRGAVVAFVGPNGAGKTTTIHTVLGFLTPNAGHVRLFGAAARAGGVAARRVSVGDLSHLSVLQGA